MSSSSGYLIHLVILLFAVTSTKCHSSQIAYAVHKDGGIDVTIANDEADIKEPVVATIIYKNDINNTGWAFFELKTNSQYDDELQAYSAGFIEGYITRDLIWMHYQNTMKGICDGKKEVCQRIEQYINKNERWVTKMVNKLASTDSYWYQVKLYLKQLEGLTDGYGSNLPDPAQGLSYRDFLYLNMQGDLEDLMPALGDRISIRDGHCSALIKILPDWSDVYASQVTWTSYQSMLRIQKKYTLGFKILPDAQKTIKGHTMSFSSYPGTLQSGDDFYITSAKLIAMETTIGNSNPALWRYVSPIGQVLEFVRTMVANRLAGTARTWVDITRKYNSGTYNNQWMIIDYKRFSPGSAENIQSDFLWVLEQMPGTTEASDMTNFIKNGSYWPSYNIAYYPNIFNLSGGPDSVSKYGDWFTYEKHPRAQIFKRDHGKVHNMDDMLGLMTYTDFKHDPLSKCECVPPYSAENAISARNDLNLVNGTYPFKALSHRSHGATDVKISNLQMVNTFQFLSQSGPAYNLSRDIPPFKWSEVDFGPTTPHIGHPDLWQFKPLTHKWEWNE